MQASRLQQSTAAGPTISPVLGELSKGRNRQMKLPDRDNLIDIAHALFYAALVLALLWMLGWH
jgi:hypothetical protein